MRYKKIIDFLTSDRLMRNLIGKFQDHYGVPVYFEKLNNANGITQMTSGTCHVENVTIEPYCELSSESFSMKKLMMPVYTLSFLRAVYALKHEERHVQQFQALERGETLDGLTEKDMQQIACEKLSITYNQKYYHQGYDNVGYDNGQHMLMELDAQKFAMKELYEYCKSLYNDDKRAEQLVVDLVKLDYGQRGTICSDGRYYIPIGTIKNLNYDKIMRLYDDEIDKIRQGANCREYISRTKSEHTVTYEYDRSIKNSDTPMSVSNFINEVNLKDHVFRWFVARIDLTSFDVYRFPKYFATSHDVDKFVIAASNIILNEEEQKPILKEEFESIPCLENTSMLWDDAVLKQIFDNNQRYSFFSFDKYKMKQDLERRLQIVQDNAEEKGLISDEEIDVEREVKL